MTVSTISSSTLCRRSDFYKLVCLTLPLMMTLCVTNLIGFCDRAFLGHCSIEALEGYVSGFILTVLFQAPLMRVTTLGQVFVSFYNSANERHRVGVSVWQMIWFSLFSTLISLPLGYAVMPLIFGGSPVEAHATKYFTYMLWGNFLFPLQTALSSFFIGQRKSTIVLITTLGAQVLHILLDYLLIFGVGDYFPPLGVQGAAIALITNRAVVCLILFSLFLRKNQRKTYGTDHYHFNWKVFYSQMRTGIPMSLAAFLSMSSWAATSRIMAMKGADYLMVFSVGSSLTVCFAFANDALFQAVLTSASGIFGSRNFSAIKRLIGQAFLLLCIMMLILAIPFLIYPEKLLSFLFATSSDSLSRELLFFTCYSSWLFLFCEGILFTGMGLLAATRQTSFFIFTSSIRWVTSYASVFVIINLWHGQATIFWLLISASTLIISALYFIRAKQLISSYSQVRLE